MRTIRGAGQSKRKKNHPYRGSTLSGGQESCGVTQQRDRHMPRILRCCRERAVSTGRSFGHVASTNFVHGARRSRNKSRRPKSVHDQIPTRGIPGKQNVRELIHGHPHRLGTRECLHGLFMSSQMAIASGQEEMVRRKVRMPHGAALKGRCSFFKIAKHEMRKSDRGKVIEWEVRIKSHGLVK